MASRTGSNTTAVSSARTVGPANGVIGASDAQVAFAQVQALYHC